MAMRKANLLLILTVFGAILGILVGICLHLARVKLTARQEMGLAFPGELFLRALNMLLLPFIALTCGYYLFSTVLAILTGLILVLLIRPGLRRENNKSIAENVQLPACRGRSTVDSLMDILRNSLPENLVQTTFQSTQTCVQFTPTLPFRFGTATLRYEEWQRLPINERHLWEEEPFLVSRNGANLLGVAIFGLLLGSVIHRMGIVAQPLRSFFSAFEMAIMQMLTVVIWFSPIGIAFLLAGQIVRVDNPLDELMQLALYTTTVIAGLFIHSFIILPLLLLLIAKRNPLKYSCAMLQAFITSFGTASSSATMPITVKCVEANRIDKRISRLVVPLGTAINKDGTALYQVVAAVYIGHTIGHPMGLGNLILIALAALLASIATAGRPQAGLVNMAIVLVAVGIEPEYFVLVIPVDWLLDRIRTTVNVQGHGYGAAIVDRFCRDELISIDYQNDYTDAFTLDQDHRLNKIHPDREKHYVSTIVIGL